MIGVWEFVKCKMICIYLSLFFNHYGLHLCMENHVALKLINILSQIFSIVSWGILNIKLSNC